MAPEELRKTVTVLFADVTGSTALGERLDPEALRRVMSRYFEETRATLERHGGTVEKFIGDAVMAVFGVPVVHEDDALRAVRAAADIRASLAALNEELEQEWGVRLQVRMGLNTGEVVAGDPSEGQSFVTGDAVNVAARLQQAAEPGDIVIGENTLRLVREAVNASLLDPLALRGKTEAVPAFRVLGVTPSATPMARRLDSPMVGRERELSLLRGAFDQATGRRVCAVATVMGDAGLGKSRLVGEFVSQVDREARVLSGRCLPYGEGITFWPIGEVVREAAGLFEDDTPEEARVKIARLLVGHEDADLALDRVASAIGLSEAGGEIQETFWAVRRLLEALAGVGPLVIVFDDIHWAEAAFLDLVQYLAAFSSGHPILLLCTARPDLRETRPDWGEVGTTVTLEPLTKEQSEQLISNLLGRAGVAGDVRTRITEAAEGNPLFVEEMLRMLIDDGLLVRDNGHWQTHGDLAMVSVPGTIQALLSARLERLDREERGVIQRASVVGKVFWWGAVAELSPSEARSQVGPRLQTLLRKELVLPDVSRFAGEDAFRFSHILVRDAAYESMPKSIRADLHERFVTWLERKAGDRIPEYEEILGYHLEHAFRYREALGPLDEAARELGSRAAERLAAAGRRAFAQGDVSATVKLLSRALGLLPSGDPFRLKILPDLGIALAQSDIPRADAVLTEALDAARAMGDRRLEALAGTRRVFVRLLLDPQVSQTRSLKEAERWVAAFEEAGDESGLAEAWRVVGVIRFWEGQAGVAEENLERAMQHARRAKNARQEAEILRWLPIVILQGPAQADEAIVRLTSLLNRAGGDRRVEVSVIRVQAELEAMRGRFDVARGLIEHVTALAQELGDQVALTAVLRHAGYMEILVGDPVAAESHLRTSYEILERIRDFGHLASHAPDLADALYRQGRYDEALHITEVAERITIGGDVDAEVRWRQVRAKILAQRGRADEAESLAREAIRLASATDYLELNAVALASRAEVLRLAGRDQEAAASLREANRLFERKGNLVMADRTRAELEELSEG